EDLYKEIILDYYKNPRNFGTLENPDMKAMDTNPLCGDELEMQIKLGESNKIADIRFNGKGCAISMASASILTEMVQGKNIDDARKFKKEELLGAMGTPNLGPVRIKCALLPLKVLKLAIYSYLGKELEGDDAKL
ncbi:MAG: SUF system NifU family Fe-S cluster assembly protein, partial [Nitrosopumilus sp.]